MSSSSPPSSSSSSADPRPVFFFDIDNCLYSRSKRVHEMMSGLIDGYFEEHLSLSRADAEHLHQKYYRDYGLAIEGLVRHHKIDPLEYNAKVDDALPLEGVIVADPALRRLLLDFDRTKVRLWLFTNAYVTHAKRVVRLLGVDDLFDGITFSDYGTYPLLCKPSGGMFDKAESQAGVPPGRPIYFVDDSRLNCTHAEARGWVTVNKIEPEDPEPAPRACKHLVRDLGELRQLFPQLFKTAESSDANGQQA